MSVTTSRGISAEQLLEEVRRHHEMRSRLVQICVTADAGNLVLDYSFDREGEFTNLRLTVAPGATLPSISPIYWCAFVYENEIHDLFGLKFDGIAVDFGGQFYKTSVKFPFACASAAASAGPLPPAAVSETNPN